ncbi:MAG: hypothetical protein JWQ48_1548 [Conexibacter sp.]|jgi:hypothetical protein|nr:hypothetical protein [Conexibacter sp.]
MGTHSNEARVTRAELQEALDASPTVRRNRLLDSSPDAPGARWDWDGQPEEARQERDALRSSIEDLQERVGTLDRDLAAERRRAGDLSRALRELADARLWNRRTALRRIRIQGLLK